MVISANQFSIYGQVADTNEEFPVGQKGVAKPKVSQLDKVVIHTTSSCRKASQ